MIISAKYKLVFAAPILMQEAETVQTRSSSGFDQDSFLLNLLIQQRSAPHLEKESLSFVQVDGFVFY